MATKQEVIDFINKIGPVAVAECKKRGYGNTQAWTCISQACCESAYGTSKLMRNANSFLGIKATKSWINKATYGGLVYNAKTKECYDGKTYTTITDCFRAYRCIEDCVSDYFDLIEMARYKTSLKKETVQDCITVIKNGGYATSPTYITTICTIFEEHKSLITQYTVNSTPVISTPVETKEVQTYTVVKGDCLWSISKKLLGNGVYWRHIADYNGLKNNLIYAGQVLKIPEREG